MFQKGRARSHIFCTVSSERFGLVLACGLLVQLTTTIWESSTFPNDFHFRHHISRHAHRPDNACLRFIRKSKDN